MVIVGGSSQFAVFRVGLDGDGDGDGWWLVVRVRMVMAMVMVGGRCQFAGFRVGLDLSLGWG